MRHALSFLFAIVPVLLAAQQRQDTTVSVTSAGDTVIAVVYRVPARYVPAQYEPARYEPDRIDSVRTILKRAPVIVPSPVVAAEPFMWGQFHVPLATLGDTTYGQTSTVRYGSNAKTLAAMLDSIKGKKAAISFAPTAQRQGFVETVNGVPRLSAKRWRDTFDLTWSSSIPLLKQAIADGRIDKVYLMDEPDCAKPCWYGAVITPAMVDTLAMHVKLRLGDSARIAVRVTPDWFLKAGYRPKAIDVTWAQYEGKYHVPSGGQTPEQFAAKQVADAKALGVGLVLGLNVLDGGNGPCVAADSGTGAQGTFFPDPNPTDGICKDPVSGSWYRYQASPSEFERAFTVFAKEPYVCAVHGWKWTDANTKDASWTAARQQAIQAYYSRPAIISASKRVSAIAKARNPGPCRRTP